MAAGTWKVFSSAKKALGQGSLNLGTASPVYMCLCRASASAGLLGYSSSTSTWASVGGEISATGGYAANGRALPAHSWMTGASSNQMKFRYTTAGLVFTASGAALGGASAAAGIKYAVLRASTSAAGGKCIAFVTLSSTAFSVSSGNTLTIAPEASTGRVFSLV